MRIFYPTAIFTQVYQSYEVDILTTERFIGSIDVDFGDDTKMFYNLTSKDKQFKWNFILVTLTNGFLTKRFST